MITADDARLKYGPPEKEAGMVLFRVPPHLQIGAIPTRIYCNRDLVAPLTKAFTFILERGLSDQVRTWDGCFNIRPSKGNDGAMSLHAWGLAIDINAAWNSYGRVPTLSPELVKAFTDAGFAWGGWWRKPDGMHFELARLPT
jgi:hypothetical protein